jgi:hypothetical protein
MPCGAPHPSGGLGLSHLRGGKAFVDHLVNWEYVAEMYRAAAK